MNYNHHCINCDAPINVRTETTDEEKIFREYLCEVCAVV